jgi:hypothetical protein
MVASSASLGTRPTTTTFPSMASAGVTITHALRTH